MAQNKDNAPYNIAKIIPDLIPHLEPDENVDFDAILNGFDPSSLMEKQMRLITRSRPDLSVCPDNHIYMIDKKSYPVPPVPLLDRELKTERCLGTYTIHKR